MPYQAPFGPATYAVLGGPGQGSPTDPGNVVEARFAALSGGIGAIATASAATAVHLVVATLLSDKVAILAAEDVADPVSTLLLDLQPRFGVITRTVRGWALSDWEAALDPEVRLIIAPNLGHRTRRVLDIPALAEWAHGHGLPLLIDGTDAGPALQRPLDLGADFVVYDAELMTGGAGGVLVDGGRFDWFLGRSYPALTAPSPATGRCPAADEPLTAFLNLARQALLSGVEIQMSGQEARRLIDMLPTLALASRTRAACATTLAGQLAHHPAIAVIQHPSLPTHPDHGLATHLFPHGAGEMLSFALAGGEAMAADFVTSLRLIGPGAPGPHRTTLIPPPNSGTKQPDLWRLTVGLEEPTDLLEDLGRALNRVAKALETAP